MADLWFSRTGEQFRGPDDIVEVLASVLESGSVQTPLLLMDRDVIADRIAQWRKWLPSVTPHYAVKANCDPLVLHEIFSQGVNADVASAYEIRICQAVGLSGERMILSNPRKDRDTIRAAVDSRISAIVVDSEEEIRRMMGEFQPNEDYSPILIVRIKVPARGVSTDLSSKFGVRVLPAATDPFARPLPELDLSGVERILDAGRRAGFRKFGLSTHVGTQCTNSANYLTALEVFDMTLRRIQDKGLDLQVVDIGGGFADSRILASHGTEIPMLLGRIGAAVRRWQGPPVQFVAEPGRYFVADAGTLVTQVIYEQETNVTGRRIQIDDGIYRTLSGRIHDERAYQFSALRTSDPGFSPSGTYMVVWGCSCDSFDQVAEQMVLPSDLQTGDYLLADILGAYSTSFGSNTNGFQPAPIVSFGRAETGYTLRLSPLSQQNAILLKAIREWCQDAASNSKR
jgi:ornithine decarboxylase